MTSLSDRWRQLPSSFLLTSLSLFGLSAAALGQDLPGSVVSENEGSRYGRIRHLEGALTVRGVQGIRSADLLGVNSPILPGDQVTTGEGRAELQLPDASLVRLARLTEIEASSIADFSNRVENRTWFRLTKGSAYFYVARIESTDDVFRVDTPAASVYLLTPGVYRVDAAGNGSATACSHSGVAEVVSEGISVLVRSNEKTDVAVAHEPSPPRSFDRFQQDVFDRWNRHLQASYVKPYDRLPTRDVPPEVGPYVTELAYFGDWVEEPGFGWVWSPSNRATDWSPYRDGRWNASATGWIWVSHEPWGWAPYHYGRWHLTSTRGWIWIPGRVFGGAWVSWAVAPGILGWSPLNYYNQPAYYPGLGQPAGTAERAARAWTFVQKDAIADPRIGDVMIVSPVAELALARSVLLTGPPSGTGVQVTAAATPSALPATLRPPQSRGGGSMVSFRTLEGRGRIRSEPSTTGPTPPPTTEPGYSTRTVAGTGITVSGYGFLQPKGDSATTGPEPGAATSPPLAPRAYVATSPDAPAGNTGPIRIRVIPRSARTTLLNRILQSRKAVVPTHPAATAPTINPALRSTPQSRAPEPLDAKPGQLGKPEPKPTTTGNDDNNKD